MQSHRSVVSTLSVMFLVVSLVIVGVVQTRAQEPVIPVRDFGQSLIAAYEGWYQNPDGSFTFLVGYFNRNMKETHDIPVGPNNRVEPGGPDRGQPTHFLPRRQWGVFAVTVPPDFGEKQLTWTLVANGETTSVPMHLIADWAIEPFENAAMGNTPPVVTFEPGGPEFQGPPLEVAASFSTRQAEPVTLTMWVADDLYRRPGRRTRERPPLAAHWSKFRGPGVVTFGTAEPEVPETGGEVTTTAAFDTPGEYILRAEITDTTGKGGGGSQCCWTTAHVKVTVTP